MSDIKYYGDPCREMAAPHLLFKEAFETFRTNPAAQQALLYHVQAIGLVAFIGNKHSYSGRRKWERSVLGDMGNPPETIITETKRPISTIFARSRNELQNLGYEDFPFDGKLHEVEGKVFENRHIYWTIKEAVSLIAGSDGKPFWQPMTRDMALYIGSHGAAYMSMMRYTPPLPPFFLC